MRTPTRDSNKENYSFIRCMTFPSILILFLAFIISYPFSIPDPLERIMASTGRAISREVFYDDPLPLMHPFPPEMAWESPLEMAKEVFRDMGIPWVREFILHSDIRSEVDALRNPYKFSRAISTVHDVKIIPELSNGFYAKVSSIRLNIPVQSTGQIGVGFGISKNGIEGGTTTSEFFRFVSHYENKSQLNIWIKEDTGTVEVAYQSYRNGSWKYANLVLNSGIFLEAFDVGSSRIKFRTISQSLVQSITRYTFHQDRAEIAINNNIIESFPYSVAENIGHHLFKSVFCSFADTQPMMVFSTHCYGSWSLKVDANALRRMRKWGITDRLQKLPKHPFFEIPNHSSLRKIAPGPSPAGVPSEEEEKEQILKAKIRKRKLQQRVSAARCNDRGRLLGKGSSQAINK